VSDPVELRLLEDVLSGGGALALPDDRLHRVIYVVHGSLDVGGHELGDDEAWHGCGAARLTVGPGGAALWRWELAPAGSLPVSLRGDAGTSALRLRCPLAWPVAEQMLMRADSVAFPPGGCAYLHTHQGPGIRCLIEGGIRIECDGRSTSYGPGGAWFESGPQPVFAQAAADRPSRFIRVMILPAHLQGRSSIAYVRPKDRDQPKSQTYKQFVDAPLMV